MDWGEIAGIAEEVPLLTETLGSRSDYIRPAEIVGLIGEAPGQAAGHQHNGIDRPAFEQLPETFLSRKVIVQRKREAMPDVEIRVSVHLLTNISIAVQGNREVC